MHMTEHTKKDKKPFRHPIQIAFLCNHIILSEYFNEQVREIISEGAYIT